MEIDFAWDGEKAHATYTATGRTPECSSPDSCYSYIARLPPITMTVTVKNRADLVVPPSLQRQAGIKTGDRLEFKVSSRTITITAVDPATYKPTKSELAAIRKGEAAIAGGQHVSLTDFLHGLDPHRRKSRH
jgi:bifunctional DNA-binding transcriptional regulator/antitoxin component of YhaV-PrlF toxin-antitoxin module